MRGFAVLVLAQLAGATTASAIARAEPPDAAPLDAEPAAAPGPPLHEDREIGPLIRIEAIEITGNTATQTEIIRRAIPITPGQVLHASDHRLRDIRYKVLALGYFRDVTLAMRKGSARGEVVLEVHVVERGTFVLNRLWFGTNTDSPYWFGADAGDRNLLGLGIQLSGGVIYAAHGDIPGSRDQWAGEVRLADSSLRGTRWGAQGSLTLVHGSDAYRVAGQDGQDDALDFRAFPYRRFGGQVGVTYDASALTRLSGGLRLEAIDTALPAAPTEVFPDGHTTGVELSLHPGASMVDTIAFGVDRDTRPDPILPHSGGRLTASVELGTAALGSDYDFATVLGRYEHWWPIAEERQTIGIRLAGGIVIGDAPRFDRIHISDVDHMLTPRALGLVLSTASPLDFLGTSRDKPSWGTLGGSATVEYAIRLFRGSGANRIYGGDAFLGAGLWALADESTLALRDTGLWRALPVDLYVDAGMRLDTDIGVFELTIGNALGRLR